MGFWHESITKTEGECFIKIEVCLLFTSGGDKKLGPMLLCHQPMSGSLTALLIELGVMTSVQNPHFHQLYKNFVEEQTLDRI